MATITATRGALHQPAARPPIAVQSSPTEACIPNASLSDAGNGSASGTPASTRASSPHPTVTAAPNTFHLPDSAPVTLPDADVSTIASLSDAESASVSSTPASTRAPSPLPKVTAEPSNLSFPGSAPTTAPDADIPMPQPWTLKFMKRHIKVKTLVEITAATAAIFGVVWATFVSLPGLKLQKWSAGNDFLQACLSLDSPSVRSMRCNETIMAGPLPPPKWKRSLDVVAAATFDNDPLPLAAAISLTVAAVVLATSYFRPRMEPFHPAISMARCSVGGTSHGWHAATRTRETGMAPTKIKQVSKIRFGTPYRELVRVAMQETAWASHGEEGSRALGTNGLALYRANHGCDTQRQCSDYGERIGVWYESDSESLVAYEDDSDTEESDGMNEHLPEPRDRTDRCLSCLCLPDQLSCEEIDYVTERSECY